VQDTGTDGARWALANRGAPAAARGDLLFAWTLRGAPHAYRRADVAEVTVATAPFSEADAAKRVFDASKPLRAAGIEVLDALRTVATGMRRIVTRPTAKGEVSRRLSDVLPAPYLRRCRPCNAIHTYEQPFRLAALQAGLELVEGTSPPVLRRIPKVRAAGFRRSGAEAGPRHDVVRAHLRAYPGAAPADVAAFLDSTRKDVDARWPEDAVELGEGRWGLPGDPDELGDGTGADRVVRLLGSHDPFLQLRDRDLLVPDRARHKALWPILGRPGAVVADGELLGTWRPKASGARFTLRLEPWTRLSKRDRNAIGVEAERLAAHRGATLAAVVED
jgi:hypothetical protein